MRSLDLTPEEAQVIAAMRKDATHGQAIYKYARNFSDFSEYPDNPEPFSLG
jgi:hypothetical protein